MSEKILFELVQKTVNDPAFRNEIAKDIDVALKKHGYISKLTTEELTAIKDFHAKNKSLNGDELNKLLVDVAKGKRGGP